METKWLHDGNLEEEKKQKIEFIKHVWGKNRNFNSVPPSAMWKLTTLFTKIVLYLYIYKYSVVNHMPPVLSLW